ncbi:PEPxxWA-CTERM sorting domain-containing protein [Phenylobacterium sp.]|uniref:PEPxxWA-CTERM sorting domain-containing protein n=1 Tax=Phenylobacterium sp. TaxID=1871053 RepID=UPI0025FE62B2|nr:PEPxxWA-CTERM sorting domain-containing protein [Phenylobacterium sp.]MBX3482161.1 PEPxxWA-CTERM sorting domain-containing protein [Phenylobacterium sp.]MCW5760670.1 PEPxxWA-CTERM sorting domain-containing protein [Phenylobacterium sp.]
MFSRTLQAVLLGSALIAGPAAAQAVNEVGDAGQSLATAQVTSGYVATINGYLGNLATDGTFVPDTDMYRITITNPALFSASATTHDLFEDFDGDTFPHDDTELFLFDAAGILVGYSDDYDGFNPRFALGDFAGLAAGDYFLAFNLFSIHPTFADGPFDHQPTGGLEGPLTGWFGYSQHRTGAYTITLTGVGSRTQAEIDLPPATVPEPAAWALLILGFGAAGSALRRAQSRRSAPLPA